MSVERDLVAAFAAWDVPMMRSLRLRLMFQELMNPDRVRMAWVPLAYAGAPHASLPPDRAREVFLERARALAGNRSRLQELGYFFPEATHILAGNPEKLDKALSMASRFANIWRVDWPQWTDDAGEMRLRVEALVAEKCPDHPETLFRD